MSGIVDGETVAVWQGLIYLNVPIVSVDQSVWADVFARTATEYVPASASTLDAANVIVLPDNVIKELLGPPVTVF